MPKASVARTPFTPEENSAALALGNVSYQPRTWAKRFGNDIAAAARAGIGITEKQRGWLWIMVQKYRRQLPVPIVANIPAEFIK